MTDATELLKALQLGSMMNCCRLHGLLRSFSTWPISPKSTTGYVAGCAVMPTSAR